MSISRELNRIADSINAIAEIMDHRPDALDKGLNKNIDDQERSKFIAEDDRMSKFIADARASMHSHGHPDYDKIVKEFNEEAAKRLKQETEAQPIDRALSSAQKTQFVRDDKRNIEEEEVKEKKPKKKKEEKIKTEIKKKPKKKTEEDEELLKELDKELKKEAEREKALSEIIEPVGKERDCLTRGAKSLQPHQKSFVKAFMENQQSRGAIAIHGIGSGKTLTAVVTSQCYLDEYPDSKVVVITPASLQANFKQELYEYSKLIKTDKRYEFYTFDSYYKDGGDCTDALLIIDEAHNLRNDDGVKYKEIEKCAKKAKKVLLLTATPIVNNNFDIISLIWLIDPSLSVDATRVERPSKESIREIFDCKVSIFTPSDSEKQKYFPKVFRVVEPLKMTKSYLEKYQNVEQNNLDEQLKKVLAKKKGKKTDEEIDFADVNPTAFYNGVRRSSNALEAENSPKIKYIINLIKKGDENKKFNRKFVIFSHFLDAGSKLLIKSLKNEGIPFGEINGSMAKSKRENIVKKYVDGDIDVIIISKAGAEGLNLKNTGHLVIMEPAWNETLIDQVIGRAVRFKGHEDSDPSKRNVKIHQLLLLKPDEYDDVIENGFSTGSPKKGTSIDLYLYMYSLEKQTRIDDFLHKIRKYAKEIDDPSCKVAPKEEKGKRKKEEKEEKVDAQEEERKKEKKRKKTQDEIKELEKELEEVKRSMKSGNKRTQNKAKDRYDEVLDRLRRVLLEERKLSGVPFVHPMLKTLEEFNKKINDLITAGTAGMVPLPNPKDGYKWPEMQSIEKQLRELQINYEWLENEPDAEIRARLEGKISVLLDKITAAYDKYQHLFPWYY